MDYNEYLVFKELLESSRILADEIMDNTRRLGLTFTLDELTEGDGNCCFFKLQQNQQKLWLKLNQIQHWLNL